MGALVIKGDAQQFMDTSSTGRSATPSRRHTEARTTDSGPASPLPFIRRNSFWLALSLLLCLISAVGAFFVQNDGGHVAVKDMRWETSSGENQRPAVQARHRDSRQTSARRSCVSHGWWNNKRDAGRQLRRARPPRVRRHVDRHVRPRQLRPAGRWRRNRCGTGMYDAVKQVADLPYVDTTKIGISGHSNGARAANCAIPPTTRPTTPLIKSVLLVDNEPIYADAKTARTSTTTAPATSGSWPTSTTSSSSAATTPTGSPSPPPRDYIGTPNAQSFLELRCRPDDRHEERVAGEFYTQTSTARMPSACSTHPAQTHPWGPFSKQAVTDHARLLRQVPRHPEPDRRGLADLADARRSSTRSASSASAIFLRRLRQGPARHPRLRGPPSQRAAPARPRDPHRARLVLGRARRLGDRSPASATSLLSQNAAHRRLGFNSVPRRSSRRARCSSSLCGPRSTASLTLHHHGRLVPAVRPEDRRRPARDRRPARLEEVLPGHRPRRWSWCVAAFGDRRSSSDYFFKTDFRIWVLAIKTFTPDKMWIAFLYLPFFLRLLRRELDRRSTASTGSRSAARSGSTRRCWRCSTCSRRSCS